MDQVQVREWGESSITRIDRACFAHAPPFQIISQTQTEIGFAAKRTRATTNESALAFPLAIQRFAPALRRAVGRYQTTLFLITSRSCKSCAAMLTAISGGEFDPIGRPIGQ